MFTPHGRLYGYRYLGNTSKKEVHDLDKETENCQIQEIIDADILYFLAHQNKHMHCIMIIVIIA